MRGGARVQTVETDRKRRLQHVLRERGWKQGYDSPYLGIPSLSWPVKRREKRETNGMSVRGWCGAAAGERRRVKVQLG